MGASLFQYILHIMAECIVWYQRLKVYFFFFVNTEDKTTVGLHANIQHAPSN